MNEHATERSLDYRAIVRRRRWTLIVPALAGGLAGVLLVVLLPRTYVASATLAVRTPSLGGPLAPSSPQDQSERIRAVTQELLSEAVIEPVARNEGLLAGGRDADEVVADVRAHTAITLPPRPLATPAGRFEPDTFLVSYTGATPELAARMANGLTRAFVERHSRLREARAEDTSAFLARQLDLSREKLTAAEAALRDTRAEYQGRLPEQALANLQSVSDLRRQSDSHAQALSSERERLTIIDQQIAALQQDAQAAAASAAAEKSSARVGDLERQLVDARQQYTARHPEIQRLEAELARVQAEDAAQAAPAIAPTAEGTPVYRQLMADRENARIRIRDLEGRIGRLDAQTTQYQERLDAAPMVEQRLASVSQAYDFEKAQYQKLAEQYQAALISEDLERGRAREQFVVLYGARLPRYPSSPNIPLVLAFAALAGIACGGALAVARELLDRTVHDGRALEQEFGLPVLAEIPHFQGSRR